MEINLSKTLPLTTGGFFGGFLSSVRLKLTVTKQATYGSCLARTTLLRASKAQSNLRPRNIVKKGTKKFDQPEVKEVNKWTYNVPYILGFWVEITDRPFFSYKRSLSLIIERVSIALLLLKLHVYMKLFGSAMRQK